MSGNDVRDEFFDYIIEIFFGAKIQTEESRVQITNRLVIGRIIRDVNISIIKFASVESVDVSVYDNGAVMNPHMTSPAQNDQVVKFIFM